MRDIEAHCAHCKAPMSLSLYSFAPLQFGSKRNDFYCDLCNQPSILNLRSRLAGAVVVLALIALSVALALRLRENDLATVAVLVLGPILGIVLGSFVCRLMPTLVKAKSGT